MLPHISSLSMAGSEFNVLRRQRLVSRVAGKTTLEQMLIGEYGAIPRAPPSTGDSLQ